MSTARQSLGRLGERLAANRLAAEGYAIEARNYRCPAGEIDLIARHGGEWVFVEVRARRGDRFGTPEDSVTPRKQARLIACAEHYLNEHDLGDVPWRIDVVAVQFSPAGQLRRVQIVPDAVRR